MRAKKIYDKGGAMIEELDILRDDDILYISEVNKPDESLIIL